MECPRYTSCIFFGRLDLEINVLGVTRLRVVNDGIPPTMRYSTWCFAKMRNRPLKSEFIRMLSFHAAPVVGNEFPSRGKAGLASRFLPLVDE